MTELTRRAAGAAWWSTLEIAGRYGVQVIVTIVLARLLRPADFGLIAMLLVFTSIGAILINSGFSTALIQRQNIDADDETTVFAFSLIAGSTLAALLWFCAPVIAGFYKQPALIPLTRLVVWIMPIGALAAVPDALLTKQLNFAARARAEIIASGISGIIAIALAWRGYGVWSIGWQMLIAISLKALMLWLSAGWKPMGRFTKPSFDRLFAFGGFMLLAQLLDTVFVRLQSLLLGRLFDAATLGYFTLAQNAQQAPASFMGSVLNRVGIPVFSEVADQPTKLQSALRLSLRTSLFVFLPCMIGLALVARPLIILVYGSRWQPAAPVLSLLAVSASLWPLHVLNLAIITARGHSNLVFRLELVKKPVSITLIIIGSVFGPVGVAFSVLVSSIFAAFVNTWYSKQQFNYGVFGQLRDQRATFALCGIAAFAGWSVLHWTVASPISTIIAILLAGTIYLGGAALFRNPALYELVVIAKSLRIRSEDTKNRNPK